MLSKHARFAIDSFKKCIATVLAILQLGFGLPSHASAPTQLVKLTPQQSALVGAVFQKLASARVSLGSAQGRAALVTNAALAPLHAPSDFARLTSQFEEPLIATGPTSRATIGRSSWRSNSSATGRKKMISQRSPAS